MIAWVIIEHNHNHTKERLYYKYRAFKTKLKADMCIDGIISNSDCDRRLTLFPSLVDFVSRIFTGYDYFKYRENLESRPVTDLDIISVDMIKRAE